MIETIIIAMLVAKIRGYKLKPILLSWEVYPILAFAGLYMFLNMEVFLGNYNFIKYAGILETIYICTFLILIYRYKQYVSAIIGSISIIIGTLLNKVAIYANGGKMPVFPTLSYITGYVRPDVFTKVKDIHVMGSEATKLIFLTDIIDLGYSILSIGDIFIRFFAFIIIYSCIKSANNSKEKVDDDIIQSTL